MTSKYELERIQFSIWSDDDIRKASVCNVTETKSTEKGIPVRNGLRDPRMGPLFGKCETCGKSRYNCLGHYGHIELHGYFYNVSWSTSVIYLLRCACRVCGNSLLREKQKITGPKNKSLQQYSKNTVSKCEKCKTEQSKYSWNRKKQCILRNKEEYLMVDVVKHLELINDDLKERIGVPSPMSLLMSVIPVPPPHVRPPILAGKSIRGEDDLTYRLLQIIRLLKKHKTVQENNMPTYVIQSARDNIQLAITGYINHKKLHNPRKKSAKREYSSLQQQLIGKEGRMRGNLMGKRCDFTARSVISGDPSLRLNEVGVPKSVAEKLTIPVKVTDYNVNTLQQMLDKKDSPIKFVIKPNGSRIDLSFSKGRNIQLETGYQVERMLQDGDVVLFNRQPSLHKMSIMAHYAKILPYSTFRMNLSVTPPYNADFDVSIYFVFFLLKMPCHLCNLPSHQRVCSRCKMRWKTFLLTKSSLPGRRDEFTRLSNRPSARRSKIFNERADASDCTTK